MKWKRKPTDKPVVIDMTATLEMEIPCPLCGDSVGTLTTPRLVLATQLARPIGDLLTQQYGHPIEKHGPLIAELHEVPADASHDVLAKVYAKYGY